MAFFFINEILMDYWWKALEFILGHCAAEAIRFVTSFVLS